MFSIGTTPNSVWPRSTSSNTAAIVPTGTSSALWPKRSIAARWLNVNSGPEVRDASRRLDRAGGADHFAEDRADRIAGQRAVVVGGQSVEHLRLALRIEDATLLRLLGAADLLSNFGPAIDGGENLAVDAVELAAQAGDGLFRVRFRRVGTS